MSLYSVFLLFFSALCSSISSIILKYGDRLWIIKNIESSLISKSPAIFFYGIGFILYSLALKYIDVAKGYPLMVSFAIIQVMLFGFIFNETITTKMLIGTLLIIVGIYFLK